MLSQDIILTEAVSQGLATRAGRPRRKHRPKTRRREVRRVTLPEQIALGLSFPLLLLALWYWASTQALLPASILPGPDVVANTFVSLIAQGELQRDLAVSMLRVVKGFSVGASLGLVLGLGLGFSPVMEAWLGPIFRLLAQIPSLAWIPLLMMLFGLDETLKLVVLAKAALIPVAFTTASGIRNIPVAFREVGRVFRLRPLTTLFRVILPGALPSIFSGMRQGLAHVWVSLIIVEMLASTEGLGYMMNWGRTIFQLDIVMVSILVVGVIGFSLDVTLKLAEGRLLRWQGQER